MEKKGMSDILNSLLRNQNSAGTSHTAPRRQPGQGVNPDESHPRPTKRTKYTGRACQDCQRRKVKCSGEDTCIHCRLRGKPCIYTRRARRGRRQKADKTDTENRVPNEARRDIGQPLRESQPSQSNPSPNSDLIAGPERSGYATLDPALGPSLFNDNDRIISDNCVPLSLATDEKQIPEALDDDTDAYDVLETRPRSISLASQLQSLRDLVRSDREQHAPAASVKHPLFRRVLAVELPRPAKLRTLLNVYFRDVDSYFPFIEREQTEVHILRALARIGYAEHQHIVDVDFQSHSAIALLCNMIAVAECFCASGRRTEDVRPGWSIFVWGRKVLQYCSSPKYVDLDLIRYHALSAEYLMQSEMLQAASQAISNAAQLAMLVRLNDQRAWKQLSEQEIHDRKTLWWVLYFLDRKIAQRIGGPYCIRDNEVAVSEFPFEPPLASPKARTRNYIQALANLAKLWTRIWDNFFATAAPKPADSKEIEVMDTRILVAQRELPSELTWDTDLLDNIYIFQGETEPQIRRRLSIFIRLNLLRLTIRQNPLHKNDQNRLSQSLCVSLASQITDAIAAFTDSIANIEPCGFFFSTALVECIYHQMFAIQDASCSTERESSIASLKLAYQLLVRFSQTLDTAKRAIRALDSAAFPGDNTDHLLSNEADAVDVNNGDENNMLFDMSAPINIDHLPQEEASHRQHDSLGDMPLFALFDGAADESFQYNSHQQTSSNMGSGFWDMMYSLEGSEFLDNLRRV